MKIFLNKNTHVGTDEPADKTKTWLPQNLTEEANFLSNPATYGVLSGPRVKIAEGLDAQNIDAYGEKFRVYEVEPSTLVVKEYKNGSWVNMELNLDIPEEEDELQGTWVLNANVTDIDIVFTAGPMEAESYNGVYSIEKSSDKYITVTNTGVKALIFSTPSGGEKYGYFHGRTGSKWKWQYGYANADYYSTSAPTLLIYSKLSEVTNGDALLTWLKANATKQSSKPLITFTINGTSYQAEAGMTWGQFINSKYNPTTIPRCEVIGLTGVGYAWDEYNTWIVMIPNSSYDVLTTDIIKPIEYIISNPMSGGGSN